MVLIPDRWYYSSVPTAILALERTITIESFLPAGESARVRFLREARAAAKVRHPNVASVFHLGRSGGEYFYAMEFVEGETLESLIKRSRRLAVKLALAT
jgi:serine/threonine protein kinase